MGWLSTAISGVVDFISETVSKIGPVLCEFAKDVFKVFSQIPIEGVKLEHVISIASSIIHGVLEILGINSKDEPEILGAKAEQCDKDLDDFDDVKSYIQYLQNEVELDKERFDRLTFEEKLGCKMVGMTLETKAVEETIEGISISPECLAILSKLKMGGIEVNSKDLVSVIEDLKQEGITDLNDVVDLLEGKGSSDRIKTDLALSKVLEGKEEVTVDELKEIVRKYEEV